MLHHGMIATGDHFDLDSLRGAQRPANVMVFNKVRSNEQWRSSEIRGTVMTVPYRGCSMNSTAMQIFPPYGCGGYGINDRFSIINYQFITA